MPKIMDMMNKLEIDPKAKALIFDLDGTLVDTMPAHFNAWKNTVAKYGIDFTPELFEKLAGVPVYQTVDRLNELFGTDMKSKEVGDSKEAEFESILGSSVKEVEPVVDLVRRYHGKLPMAIGTGSSIDLSGKILAMVGLKKYFDIVVTSEDVSNFKPHPETFLKCSQYMGVEPEYCQVFEDGLPGLEAAEKAGMIKTDVTKYYEVTIGK